MEKVDGAVSYAYDDADNLTAAPGGAVLGYGPANQLKTLAWGSNLTTGCRSYPWLRRAPSHDSMDAPSGALTIISQTSSSTRRGSKGP